jgi:hypothetical protein
MLALFRPRNESVGGLLARPGIDIEVTVSGGLANDRRTRESIPLLTDIFQDIISGFCERTFPEAWAPVPLPKNMQLTSSEGQLFG